MDEKAKALADFFGGEWTPAVESNCMETYENEDGEEYAVGTEAEADKACLEYIEESCHYFLPHFLSEQTGLPVEVYEALSDCDGKGGWEAVKALIDSTCGMEDFAEAAVQADGRGHFLAFYDGKEVELDGFYAYRVN